MSFRLRSRSVVLGVAFVFLGALAQACGDDDNSNGAAGTPDGGTAVFEASAPGPTSTATQATGVIGVTGGKVETTTGTGVEIPAGALTGNVNITVAESPSTTPPVGAVGTPFVFGPSGLPFSAPVTAVLEFDPTKIPSGKSSADIVIMTSEDGTTFTELTTSVRDGSHVTASTTHFSFYVPVLPGGEPDAASGDDDSGTTGNDNDAGGGTDASGGNDGGGSDAATDDAGSGASDASDDGGSGASDASDDADAG